MNKFKQVVMVHYSIPPVVGGVEFMLKPLAELFAKNGWYVSMLTGKGKIDSQNIKTILVPELYPGHSATANTQKLLKTGSLPENYELSVSNFEKKLVTHIGDIQNIIIHNLLTMPFNLVATEALNNYINHNPDKKFYVWIHDMAWLMKDYKDVLFDNTPWSILKTANANVKYITISKFRKRQAVDLLNIKTSRIKIIPNGLDISGFFNIKEATKKFLHAIDLKKIAKMILVPARILPRKNLQRTIEIIKKLTEKEPDLTAVIAGSPDSANDISTAYYEKLKNQVSHLNIEDNIIFLHEISQALEMGEVENRQIVHDLFLLCNMVMLMSSDEGFGLPLLEAGIIRKPLVLSDLEVFHEVAGDNAIFISNIEPAEDAAEKILDNLQICAGKTQKMFHKVINDYTWESIWENYIKDIFEQT